MVDDLWTRPWSWCKSPVLCHSLESIIPSSRGCQSGAFSSTQMWPHCSVFCDGGTRSICILADLRELRTCSYYMFYYISTYLPDLPMLKMKSEIRVPVQCCDGEKNVTWHLKKPQPCCRANSALTTYVYVCVYGRSENGLNCVLTHSFPVTCIRLCTYCSVTCQCWGNKRRRTITISFLK